MGKKEDTEREIYAQLANYKKLNSVKKIIENSEYWGITRRLSLLEKSLDSLKNFENIDDGYNYAREGFEHIAHNREKIKEKVEAYKEWRNSQIEMRVKVTEEMQRISQRVHQLQDNYNQSRDRLEDFVGIQITNNPFNW